jgi:hypothetical protein
MSWKLRRKLHVELDVGRAEVASEPIEPAPQCGTGFAHQLRKSRNARFFWSYDQNRLDQKMDEQLPGSSLKIGREQAELTSTPITPATGDASVITTLPGNERTSPSARSAANNTTKIKARR